MSLWGRIWAAGYDRFQVRMEAELGRVRREVLAGARGRAVEIGAGTGVNVPHYPEAVEEIVLTEPDELMARQIDPKLAQHGRRASVVLAPAEALPFEDDSFDTAVAMLTLCTVPEPQAALRELHRVLRPGGRLLFLEHVRSPDPALARWQDRLHRPWSWFGRGCNCNRDTLAELEASAFAVERHERGEMPKAPPIVRPLLRGAAIAR